ncbi:MAG: hypothetical protein HC897_16505 [Thermoanaerobaculia bacterium]|nr:hypothetical protein [Thermoanaerobaculia bacterium]
MSIESFLGTYRVTTTYGTQFGLDTEVVIGSSEAGLEVQIRPPGRTSPESLPATYDAEAETLQLALAEPAAQMFIARVREVDYRAIYGVVVFEPTDDRPVRRLAVWGANLLVAEFAEPNPTVTNPARQELFRGIYRIKATAGAQFGVGSTLEVGEVLPDGTQSLSIVNALGQELADTPQLSYDAATGSLGGPTTPQGSPVKIRMSLAAIPDTTGATINVVYGLSLVGDPEQAATWAGDDDGAGLGTGGAG